MSEGRCVCEDRKRTRRKRRKRGPDRSSAYLAWIRTLRCAVCLRAPSEYFQVEAAHTSVLGPRGLGQKSSDFSAIPLCREHHQGNQDSYHRLGEQLFAQVHQLCLRDLVLTLNELYQEVSGSPRVNRNMSESRSDLVFREITRQPEAA